MKLPLLEFFFALSLISGAVKSFVLHFRMPVPLDLTLLVLLILMAIVGTGILFKGPNPRILKTQVRSIIFLGLFISWNAISLLYTVSPVYSFEKMSQFLIIGISFVIPIVVRKIDPVPVLRSYCLIVFPLAIIFCREMYTNYLSSYNEEFTNFQGNYLGLSELMGFGLICIVEHWWFLPRRSWKLPVLIFGVVIMLLLGARGPLLCLIICTGIRVFLEIFFGRFTLKPKAIFRSLVLACASAVLLAGFYLSNSMAVERLFERTLSRFTSLASEFDQEETVGSVTMSRVDLIDRAVEYSFESVGSMVFGQGVGGFGVRYFGVDQRAYPHNIFLEVLVETGIIGLILFVSFLASTVLSINPRSAISPIAILYCLLNALKSHTVVDLKVFFAALALSSIPVFIYESNDHTAERGRARE